VKEMQCVEIVRPDFFSKNGTYSIIQVPAAKDNLVWLINYAPGLCAAVDGPDAGAAIRAAENRGLKIDTIINTHTHPDHIGINRDMQKRGLLDKMRVIGPASRKDDVPGITDPVSDGDTVELGRGKGTAILTEGHINGHTSYLFDDILFCGDALFTGGCGYLFDGPPIAMHRTLVKLSSLSDDTKVCCAHEYTLDNLKFAWMLEPGNQRLQQRIKDAVHTRANGKCCVPSTIEEERATNPFMRTMSIEIRKALSKQWELDLENASSSTIFKQARQLKDKGLHKNIEWPFGQ